MFKKTTLFTLLLIGISGYSKAQPQTKEDSISNNSRIIRENSRTENSHTLEDSIWFRNVMEGTETFKLNDETIKAIEEGRLIIPQWMKSPDNKMNPIELLHGLNNDNIPDSLRIIKIDPYSLPPGVLRLYIMYTMNDVDSIQNNIPYELSDDEIELLKRLSPGGGGDFNHGLSMIFSPSYRRMVISARNAKAHKGYNTNYINPSLKLTERERNEIRKSVNEMYRKSATNYGKKSNPIDN
jgi:hypothetical protein